MICAFRSTTGHDGICDVTGVEEREEAEKRWKGRDRGSMTGSGPSTHLRSPIADAGALFSLLHTCVFESSAAVTANPLRHLLDTPLSPDHNMEDNVGGRRN